MPSPIGHSLIGLTVANLPLKKQLYQSVFWLGYVVIVANVADLDFVPGWFIGDMNRYHHGISHSIGAAIIFAIFAPFLWPISNEYYLSPIQIFHPIKHGNPGEGNSSVFADIFSHPNMIAAAIEVIIITPLWLITLWLSRRKKSSGS